MRRNPARAVVMTLLACSAGSCSTILGIDGYYQDLPGDAAVDSAGGVGGSATGSDGGTIDAGAGGSVVGGAGGPGGAAGSVRGSSDTGGRRASTGGAGGTDGSAGAGGAAEASAGSAGVADAGGSPDTPTLPAVYQAEDCTAEVGTLLGNSISGYTGTGYRYTTTGSAYLEWNNVDGEAGGIRLLEIYYWASSAGWTNIYVNGTVVCDYITGTNSVWGIVTLSVALDPGNNTVRIEQNEPIEEYFDRIEVH
jgi:hypothetical protein